VNIIHKEKRSKKESGGSNSSFIRKRSGANLKDKIGKRRVRSLDVFSVLQFNVARSLTLLEMI
jgi:hypothetical protein